MESRPVSQAAQVRNWGRWGPEDELGTLNLIPPEVRRRAAACVRTGRAFSLALPLSEAEGIQTGAIPGRLNPLRTMVHTSDRVQLGHLAAPLLALGRA